MKIGPQGGSLRDREQFEIFINRKNKEYIRKGILLELVIWEDFLDAISPTRLQDEYNKAIANKLSGQELKLRVDGFLIG